MLSLQNWVCAKFRLWPRAVSGETHFWQHSTQSGFSPQNSVLRSFQNLSIAKEHTLFLFSLALGRTSTAQRHSFDNQPSKDSRRHRSSRCLRRMFDSFDETGIIVQMTPAATSPLPLVHGASIADCRRPLLLGKLLHCVSHDGRSEQLQPARPFLRFSLFLTCLRHSLWIERCPAGCWS